MRVDRLLGVVEPGSDRVLAAEERLEIGVAAVVLGSAGSPGIDLARVVDDCANFSSFHSHSAAEHEALVELARPGLVAQRRVDAVQEALRRASRP